MKNSKNWKKLKKGIAIALAGVTLLSPISAVAENMLTGERGTGIERTADELMPADEQTGNGLEGGTGIEGEPGGSAGIEGGTGIEGEPGGSAGTEGGTGMEGEPGGSTGAEGGTGTEGEPGGSAGAEGGTGTEGEPGGSTGSEGGAGTESEPDGSAGTEDGTEGQPEADADSEEEKVDENNVSSDGSLAGQTLKFVNLYWETDDLGELEAVFDGGADEAMVQYLTRQERGVYETTIPSGDYSRVSFRVAGSGQSLDQSTYNYYGVDMRDGETETCSFIPEKNNTFYYDMGENPSYWGTDPAYEVTDPEAPVTVLKEDTQPTMMRAPAADGSGADDTVTAPETEEVNPQAGNPKPGDMVYAIDLDRREEYLAGKAPNTNRVYIGFLKEDHNPEISGLNGVAGTDNGEIYTMYEREPGFYTAPFPKNVADYSEIGFAFTNKEGVENELNQDLRHFNFRGKQPEEAGKFGYFEYSSGYTDTYYMNSSQDDSFWGAHPSNADTSLDSQVLYINVEDSDVAGEMANNDIIADPKNMVISWNGMPTDHPDYVKKDDPDNQLGAAGYKINNELPHKWIRYFQFPKNSNATENTILTIHFKLKGIDGKELTEEQKSAVYHYKFTYVPRSKRNRVNMDYIWEFNGKMWDHFEAGEGLNSRSIFFASIRNEYTGVWMRVATKDDEYADKEEIEKWGKEAGWSNDWINTHVEEFTDSENKTTTWLKLDHEENPEIYNKEENKLFSLTIPGNYKKIQFRTELGGKFYYSKEETISDESAYPCYFAYQVGEPSATVPGTSQKSFGLTGYWASVYASNASGDQSIDIPKDEFEWEEGVYYVDTTMYDYYSDWESTGRKIAEWTTKDLKNDYRHQPRVFNAAADQYYRDNVKDVDDSDLPALYEAQLEVDGTNAQQYIKNEFTGEHFWNYNKKIQNGRNQNRWTGSNGSPFYGIAADQLVNGNIVFKSETDPNVIMPTFNEAFLRGENMMDAAVGNVYKDVKFPIKMDKTKGSPTEGYWVYDSSKEEDAFRLSYDVDEGYFMNRTGEGIKFRGRYAFYPFNDVADWSIDKGPDYNIDENKNTDHTMSRANCLFGAKLKFQFRLTEDGTVVAPDGEKREPITFEFQGDDDVWIYVDDQLVLDLGGNHDAVRGKINFAGNDKYPNGFYEIRKGLGQNYAGTGTVDKTGALPWEGKLDPNKTHTLTMFYMERGLYESNMKLTFNFPRDNRFTVDKEVDVSSTREEGKEDIFAGLLENMGSFNFNLKNLVTKGETLPVEDSAGFKNPGEAKVVYNGVADPPIDATFDHGLTGKYKQENGIVTVEQNSKISGDIPKKEDLLHVTPKQALDVEDKDYLRLSMKNMGAEDRNASNLYIGFVDTNGKRVGGYAGNLNYDGESNTFLTDQDSIIRINFKNMTGDSGFSWKSVEKMLVGIRNAQHSEEVPTAYEISYAAFYNRAPEKEHIGFYVDDTQISDYGSYEAGKLTPVDRAWYIKQNKIGKDAAGKDVYDQGASWNTEAGTFNLGDDQRAIFTDKFRTGSYIQLEENRDPRIFDTEWTLTENGKEIPAKYLLTTRNDVTTVKNPNDNILEEYPLTSVEGTTPADGRKEILEKDWVNSLNFSEPSGKDTIIYRSYQDPDGSVNAGVDLGVKVKNTLKRGTLTIEKKLDTSMQIEQGKYQPAEFSFRVYYTNVAGRYLEKQLDPIDNDDRYVLQVVTVHTDDTGTGRVTIPNIPAGTKYWIEEIPSNGTMLEKIEIATPDKHENVVQKEMTIEGGKKIPYVVGTAYASDQLVTFTNKLGPFYMDIEKIWKDDYQTSEDRKKALGIDEVHIQLQRQVLGEADWQVVTEDYFNKPFGTDGEKYIVLNAENQWKTTSKTALPVRDEHGRQYKYRIQELSHQNIFNYYEVQYNTVHKGEFTDEEGRTYQHVTYQAINTPAQLKLVKEWKYLEDSELLQSVRVKLLASDKYDSNKPGDMKPEDWICYKKVTNPYHICDETCYIELNRRSDWTKSLKNITRVNSESKPYYYKMADEQIFINGDWVDVKEAQSGCKVEYGDPVSAETAGENQNKMVTVTLENTMEQGSIRLIKENKDGGKLKGAEFKIERLKEDKDADKKDWKVDQSWTPKTAATNEKGEILFDQLQYGTYRITETKAPGGYLLDPKGIIISIPFESNGDLITDSDNVKAEVAKDDERKHNIILTVTNTEIYELPSTGGPGIYRYMISGVALMIAAMFILYNTKFKKRRRRV